MNQMQMTAPPLESPPVTIRGTITAGLILIGAFFGGGFAWAALAEIAGAIVAPGIIKVDSSRKQIQHLEGGVIKDILVRDGDTVAAGDILVKLDETRAGASYAILRGTLDGARAQEARLLAEQRDDQMLSFSPDLFENANDQVVREAIAAQQDLFTARRSARLGQLEIIDNQITQLAEQIVGIEAQKTSKETQLAIIEEELASMRELYGKGLTEKTRLMALEREAARLAGEHGAHISDIASARSSMSERELEKFQLQREFRGTVADDLQRVQEEILDLSERLMAAEDVLRRVDVVAPVSGTIVSSAVHTVGGVVGPGDVLMELVPAQDDLVIEARVQPIDIDNVALGQAGRVRFSAFSSRTTPEVNATIVSVSADALEDARSGQVFYTARAAVSVEELNKLGDLELRPGMPAEVYILTGNRTPLDYLVQPLAETIRRAWRES